MRMYVKATLAAGALFALQLLAVSGPQLASLSPKSGALVLQALSDVTSFSRTGFAVLGYLALGLLSHAVPMWLAARILTDLRANPSLRFHRFAMKRSAPWTTFALVAVLLGIANFIVTPESRAYGHFALLFQQTMSPALMIGLPILLGGVFAYWAWQCLERRTQIVGFATLTAVTLFACLPTGRVADSRTRSQPDVLVIGVDSLRPDHLHSFGFPLEGLTPNIDGLVKGSVLFPEAYTPQARTFVAYMSLLTGQYPVRHGARENLYPVDLVRAENSIAHRFAAAGYETVFSMDEARFANIGDEHGFHHNASPPAGVLDFLVGGLLDSAGTNLLQVLPGSDRVLPHVAGNRAAATVYRPAVHDARLSRAVRRADPARPLFLVAHFCIAHVPFAREDTRLPRPGGDYADSPGAYRTALRVADRQVGELLESLRAAGRLRNSIVLFVSDHGEGLGMDKDRWQIERRDGAVSRLPFYGHGMPVLDASQMRVVMAYQRYVDGRPAWAPLRGGATASLVDVAPTLLSLAGLENRRERFDGVALLDRSGRPKPLGPRPVFMESGISGVSLQTAHVDPKAVAAEFAYLYTVTEDGRFELMSSQLAEQLDRKQRAVVEGGVGLTTWHSGFDASQDCWLKFDLVNRRGRCVTPAELTSTQAARRGLVCRAFAADRAFVARWCRADGALPLLLADAGRHRGSAGTLVASAK